jgi:hypothetical protein
MEHATLVYLALALVAYPLLFMLYEIWRHGGAGQTVPYVPGLWSKGLHTNGISAPQNAPRISGLGRMMHAVQ